MVRAFFVSFAGSEDLLYARAGEVYEVAEFAYGQPGGGLQLGEGLPALATEVAGVALQVGDAGVEHADVGGDAFGGVVGFHATDASVPRRRTALPCPRPVARWRSRARGRRTRAPRGAGRICPGWTSGRCTGCRG